MTRRRSDPRRRLEQLIPEGGQSRAACEALLALGFPPAVETVAGWAADPDNSHRARYHAIETLEGLTKPAAREALLAAVRCHDEDYQRSFAERALVALEGNLDADARREIEAFVDAHRADVSRTHVVRAAARVLGRARNPRFPDEDAWLERWRAARDSASAEERQAIERRLIDGWDQAADEAVRGPRFLEDYAPARPATAGTTGSRHFDHRESGVTFVRVPALAFDMGSPLDEDGRRQDETLHRVLLRPFLLARTPLTWAQLEPLGIGINLFDGETWEDPATDFSWEDAMSLCVGRWTLPTEAQWEGACRAGSWGPFGGTGDVDSMGWYGGNARAPQPVATRSANAFGLHDMHGNALEWCADAYDDAFYETDRASDVDPICFRGTELRVVRGGCWQYEATGCRSAWCRGESPRIRQRFAIRPAVPLL